jgi:hypothetical protein
MTSTARAQLDALLAGRIEALVPRSSVINELLDLRNEVDDHPQMIARIDEVLGAIPGKSVATGAWWRETIIDLRARLDIAAPLAPPSR